MQTNSQDSKSSVEYKPTTKIWLPYQPKLEDFDPVNIKSLGFEEFKKGETK